MNKKPNLKKCTICNKHVSQSCLSYLLIIMLSVTIFTNTQTSSSYSATNSEALSNMNASQYSADTFVENSDNYVDGQVIIQTEDHFSSKKTLKKELQDPEVNVEQIYETSNSTFAVLSSDTKNTKELLNTFETQDGILTVEPNHIYHSTSVANDSYSDLQWYLQDNQSNSADIDYNSSFIPTDTSTPVVVVMDSAIDVTHEDLKDAMYTTSIYNAVSSADRFAKPTTNYTHGTHIAGIIAATTNNNLGISGISNAKLLSVQIMQETSSGTIETNDMILLNAYQHIIDLKKNKHVNICAVNLSIGGDMDAPNILNNAIKEAGELGIITVCAAGNEATNIDNTPSYPACLDNDYIITVGASNRENKVAGFSNYGPCSTDVFAPGCNIFSTYSTPTYNPEVEELLGENYYYENFSNYDVNNVYANSKSSTVSLNTRDHCDYNQEDTSSLLWNIQATSGQTYGISIPYQMTKEMKKGTMGLRLKIQNKNSEYWKTIGSLIVTLDNDSETFTNNVNKLDNGKRYSSLTTDADSWTLVNSSISSSISTYTSLEDTHYLKLIFTASVTDDIAIGIDNFGFSDQNTNYAYDTGTSMSTPIVAGEIALLKSIYPNATASDLIGRVLGGIDCSNAYDGYCVTKGKINLKKAIENPTATITKVAQNQNKIMVSGYQFGTAKGTITLQNGTTAFTPNIVKWTNQEIIVDATNLPAATYDVSITCPNQPTIHYHSDWTYTGYIKCASISLNKTKISLSPGETFALQATTFPATAFTELSFSSSDTSCVTVSPTGFITALKTGNKKSATITCYADTSKKVFSTCEVTIVRKVTKLKLNKTKLTIKAGKSVKLKATITPTNATQKKVTWKSSNKKYATVNSTGKVKTKKAGKRHTVTITCKTTDGSKLKKSCKIKIR